jgi:hypothetical protein
MSILILVYETRKYTAWEECGVVFNVKSDCTYGKGELTTTNYITESHARSPNPLKTHTKFNE